MAVHITHSGPGGRGRVGRIIRILLAAMVASCLLLELAYRVVLFELPPIPLPSNEPQPPPKLILLPDWRELGGDDPVKMDPIYPWNAYRLLPGSPPDPTVRLSTQIANSILHSATWGTGPHTAPGWRAQARRITVLVWVSRNWSARQALCELSNVAWPIEVRTEAGEWKLHNWCEGAVEQPDAGANEALRR
jgi:hypothetical protein